MEETVYEVEILFAGQADAELIRAQEAPLVGDRWLRAGSRVINLDQVIWYTVERADGRPPEGVPSNQKKLTADDAERIRGMYATGNYSLADLAEGFNVHRTTVKRIVDGVYWRR